MDLALIQRTTPQEVEKLPFRDSIMLLERHYEIEHARLKNDCILHGAKLK